MSQQTHDLTKDDVLDLLSNSRRRYVIYFLEQWNGSATLNELAYNIASRETGVPVDELSEDDKRRVYISLYQTHLPKLDLYGLVEYDKDERNVELAEEAHDIGDYFFPDRGNSRNWATYYIGLAVLGIAVGLAGATAVVDATLAVWASLLVLVAVAGLGIYHQAAEGGDDDDAVFEWLVDDGRADDDTASKPGP